MATILQKALNEECIIKVALGRSDGLNSTTIHFWYKDPRYQGKTKELTRRNVINTINHLGRNKKDYSMEYLFLG